MPNLSIAIPSYLTQQFDYQIWDSIITCFDIEIREDRGGKCKGRRIECYPDSGCWTLV